jgi:hypothetical protein
MIKNLISELDPDRQRAAYGFFLGHDENLPIGTVHVHVSLLRFTPG